MAVNEVLRRVFPTRFSFVRWIELSVTSVQTNLFLSDSTKEQRGDFVVFDGGAAF